MIVSYSSLFVLFYETVSMRHLHIRHKAASFIKSFFAFIVIA